MMKKLVILRGLPGCGKSTYIRDNYPGATPYSLAPKGWETVVVSGDHYFTDFATGEYAFDISMAGAAHQQAMSQCLRAMHKEVPTILVDNTNTRAWEWAHYLTMVEVFGYEVEVIDLFDGGATDEELAERGIHNVPLEFIQRMRMRWEK